MFLDIDGNRVFTLTFGSSDRTLLAHSGWTGSYEDWIATLGPLTNSWKTVVYDHRGAGETRVAPENISHEALVSDVFAVMDRLEIEKCVLAGFSLGTVTALRAVVKHPERFDGLILMNGYGEVRRPGATVRPRIPPSKWPGETHQDHLRWFAEQCLPEPDSEHFKRWAVNVLNRSTPEVADRIMTMVPEEAVDWDKRLPEIDIPTLMVHGALDPFYETETMRYAQSLMPKSELVILENTGHLPAMTQPEKVAHLINDFFGRML